MSLLLLSVNSNTMSSPNCHDPNMLVPPQLPKTSEVSENVALKYLDSYNSYVTAYNQERQSRSKTKDGSALSSRNSSIAPSASASQSAPNIPQIIRTNNCDSVDSFTPPNVFTAYSDLILDSATDGPGFCYLALIKPECKEEVKQILGRFPTFRQILILDREYFHTDTTLFKLQISRTSLHHYHVLTGTIMPSVISTLVAISKNNESFTDNDSSLYHWMINIVHREELLERAPLLDDVLGSPFMSRRRRRDRSPEVVREVVYVDSRGRREDYTFGSRRERSPRVEYIRPISPSRHFHTGTDSSPRRGHATWYDESDNYTDEESRSRRDSGYARYVSSPTRRSDTSWPRITYLNGSTRDDDTNFERALRMSAAEYRRNALRDEDSFRHQDRSSGIETILREPRENTYTSAGRSVVESSSHLSSAASTMSVRIAGSLQDVTCNICQSAITDGGGVLPCGNVFHADCVDMWLVNHNTCPTCREVI